MKKQYLFAAFIVLCCASFASGQTITRRMRSGATLPLTCQSNTTVVDVFVLKSGVPANDGQYWCNAGSWVKDGGGGGGTPGGADTNVQFNDGGVFGGDAAFTFNKANGRLSATFFLAPALNGVLFATNSPVAGLIQSQAQLALSRGGTNANLSATGGTSQVLKQVSGGAAITVGQLACADLSNAGTGCSSASGITDPGGNGFLDRTALNTTVNRTLTGTTNQVNITNGGGGGNPVFSLPQSIHTGATPTFTGLLLSNGSSGAPVYSFTSDTTMGLFRSGTDLAISSGTSGITTFYTGATPTLRWQISAIGSLITGTDGVGNIGFSASGLRPANVFAATSVNVGNGASVLSTTGITTTGTIVQTSASSVAFESGPNGSTNPVFRIVNNTASQADGVSVTGLAAGNGTTFTALSSGSNSGFTFTPKGTGNLVLTSGTAKVPGLLFTNLADSATAPTISSGFGTSPSVPTNNGTVAFTINVGTGGTATNGVIGLPTATNGWVCWGADLTTQSTTVFFLKQIASSTTTATIANYNTAGAQAAWAASDMLSVSCRAR